MEDRSIFKLALFISIFGIIGMIGFSGQITPTEHQINEIGPGMLDQEISIEGVVDNIKESPNTHTYFLEIMDNTGKINLVIFAKEANELEKDHIKIYDLINKRISVLGTVTEYKSSLELILKDSKSIKIIA